MVRFVKTIIVFLFIFQSLQSEANSDTTRVVYPFCLELSTGVNYQVVKSGESVQPSFNNQILTAGISLLNSKIFTLGVEYSRFNLGNLNSVSYISKKVNNNSVMLKTGIEILSNNRSNLSINFGLGHYFTIAKDPNAQANGLNAKIGLNYCYTLSGHYSVFLNFGYENAFYKTKFYEGGDIKPDYRMLQASLGIRYLGNTTYFHKPRKKFHPGISLGYTFISLSKPDIHKLYDQEYFKNSFFFIKRAYPNLNICLHTKNRLIHSFDACYREDSTDYYDYYIGYMKANQSRFIINYQVNYALIEKAVSKNNLIPHIGLGLSWSHSHFNYSKDAFYDFGLHYYWRSSNNSDLFLLQLTPGIKKYYNNLFLEIGANMNLTGFTTGSYKRKYVESDYNFYEFYDTYNEEELSKTYKKALIPISKQYIMNNLYLRIGYLF